MDERLERARALLERAGMEVEVGTAGAEAEILAVRTGLEERAAVARLAPEIRALGFRYVTIELEGGSP